MHRFSKFIVFLLAALILLCVAGSIALNTFLSPVFIKEKITSKFYKHTGHRLYINGDLTWRVFPG